MTFCSDNLREPAAVAQPRRSIAIRFSGLHTGRFDGVYSIQRVLISLHWDKLCHVVTKGRQKRTGSQAVETCPLGTRETAHAFHFRDSHLRRGARARQTTVICADGPYEAATHSLASQPRPHACEPESGSARERQWSVRLANRGSLGIRGYHRPKRGD